MFVMYVRSNRFQKSTSAPSSELAMKIAEQTLSTAKFVLNFRDSRSYTPSSGSEKYHVVLRHAKILNKNAP